MLSSCKVWKTSETNSNRKPMLKVLATDRWPLTITKRKKQIIRQKKQKSAFSRSMDSLVHGSTFFSPLHETISDLKKNISVYNSNVVFISLLLIFILFQHKCHKSVWTQANTTFVRSRDWSGDIIHIKSCGEEKKKEEEKAKRNNHMACQSAV